MPVPCRRPQRKQAAALRCKGGTRAGCARVEVVTLSVSSEVFRSFYRRCFGYSSPDSQYSYNVTPHTLEVLRLLQNGEFRSGEAIGKALGITRGSVSNALANIDAFGLTVHKVHGRGYRLVTPVQWLSRDQILAQFGGQARFDIEVVDETASTNTDLLERAAQGAPSGTVLVAELQTRGRGRRGRVWHAGLGGALTFSVLWRFEQGAGFLAGLGLAVGVALVRALRSLGVEDATLKWPNVLLIRHQKLAGTLVEIQGDVLGPSLAVVGVGLNFRLDASTREHIDQAVTDLIAA